jgi:hypothetical protein
MILEHIKNEGRASYIDLPSNEDDSEISVISSAWKVIGPQGGDHHFQFIQTCRVNGRFLLHQNIIRHYKDGDGPDQFNWGHSSVEAYKSSWSWEQHGRDWKTDLIAARVFLLELPCCGGRYVSDKEITDYTCISFGHCKHCDEKWTVTDGFTWTQGE